MLLKTLLFLSDPLHPHTQPPHAFSSSLNLPPPRKTTTKQNRKSPLPQPALPYSYFPHPPSSTLSQTASALLYKFKSSFNLSYLYSNRPISSLKLCLYPPATPFIPEARTGPTRHHVLVLLPPSTTKVHLGKGRSCVHKTSLLHLPGEQRG